MAESQAPQLLRLSGLKTSQLPSASATPEEVKPFITTLLQEALPFIDSAAPTITTPSPWKSIGIKKFPESAAKVELSERVVVATTTATNNNTPTSALSAAESNSDAKAKAKAKPKVATTGSTATTTTTVTETWACRRSVHIDAATKGTASWAEFARCLRDEHAATEDAFTPTVLAHREAQSWAGARAVGPVAIGEGGGGGAWWGGFSLALVEMKHKIPPPLKPRVFPVLQLVASAVAVGDGGGGGDDDDGVVKSGVEEGALKEEFVVVSVPVVDLAGDERGVLCKEAGVVLGAYAAVERVKKEQGGRGDVEWIMATASDAKGVLPMWVQTRAVPGQIAKDVALFLGWIESERKGTGGHGQAKDGVKEEGPPVGDLPPPGDGHGSTAV